jgi:hypothetical protein
LHESLQDAARVAELRTGGELAGVMGLLCGPGAGSAGGLRAAVAADVRLLTMRDRTRTGFGQVGTEDRRSAALERYLHLQKRLLGDEDPALIETLLSLAEAAEAEWDFDLRTRCYTEAAALLEKTFGRTSFAVLLTTEVAASFHASYGEIDEAVRLAESALRVWESVPPHARDLLLVGNCRRRLALYRSMRGDLAEAREIYAAARADFRQAVGPAHYLCGMVEAGEAYCLLEQGDHAGAEALSAAALAKCLAWKPGTPSDQFSHVAFIRGHVLARQNRWFEAMPLLVQAWDPMYFQAYRLPWRAVLIEHAIEGSTALGDAAGVECWRGEAAKPMPPAPSPEG